LGWRGFPRSSRTGTSGSWFISTRTRTSSSTKWVWTTAQLSWWSCSEGRQWFG